MGCNDYNLHLEGSEGNESPTPEYKIYLDGVGVNGYSPTVDIVNENTASFQIQTNDINGSELTSPIPKLSYLQSDYVSNTSLASTLAGYLKVDGSNASNPITINNIALRSYSGGAGRIITTGTLQLHGSNTNIYGTSVGIDVKANSIDFGNWSTGKYLEADTTVKYGTSSTKYEIATVNDIGNGTITLTQGGVTKGTFTTNQSGNTTIDLDAGGSTITNPLVVKGNPTGQYNSYNFISLQAGTTSSDPAVMRVGVASDGGSISSPIYMISQLDNPLTATQLTFGDYELSLNIDDTTIKVNQDGQLYAVGGTTYTAGTGIDITGGVISIDTDVVAQLSDIPDTSDMATKTWVGNQGYLTGITSGDVTTALGYTPLQSSDLSNYVTINTAQTISSSKAFSSALVVADNQGLATGTILSNKKILQRTTGGVITLGHTADELQLIGSTTNPKYTKDGTNFSDIALKSDIPTNSNYVDLTTTQTVTGNKTFSDTVTGQSFGRIKIIDGSSNTVSQIYSYTGTTRFVGSSSYKDINLMPYTGGKLYYGSTDANNEVATKGDIPSLTNYVTNTDYATTSVGGVVKVDGSTITIDASGVISATGGSGGLQNTATGTNSLTILGTATTDNYSINIGDSSNATRSNSVAIGNSANTISQYSVAIGYNAKAGTSSDSSNGAVAIGYNAGGDYSKGNTVAIGNNAVAKSTGSIAIGDSAEVGNINYTNGIAIGEGSQVYGANSINLGYGANVTDNTLSVGFYGQNSNEPYTLLDGTTGLIPDARISSNIARTTDIPDITTKANTNLNNITTTGKSTAADWGVPSATVDVTYNSTNHSTMNGTTFTNTTGYSCWLFVQTGSNHTGNCTVYVKNISAGVDSVSMTNAGIVNSQCIPVANGQQCQFYVYVPSGSVSWTATLHRMRGGL